MDELNKALLQEGKGMLCVRTRRETPDGDRTHVEIIRHESGQFEEEFFAEVQNPVRLQLLTGRKHDPSSKLLSAAEYSGLLCSNLPNNLCKMYEYCTGSISFSKTRVPASS
ncbi:predicted protein [Histoplasma capsulatum G186AR]|uniref:Uncharacterized protein n=1 Tax=Ajellomyces capsulatus (strain G186AR / H82 / ATCC MYA-2454 / RMSCC 2432) TaxID=447093 RepID=C0NF02_AJECG|nr:uncharacterized protein HCBG_01468 [Histoplasma capsulatum G186AR]EEH09823.1 predicted protein [Histoplasma capsulatum G186AR]